MKKLKVSPLEIVGIMLLLIILPVFVWAVLTQRIELRKKAAINEPIACWNQVTSLSGVLNWPNSCKGNVSTDSACTTVLVPLTSDEILAYNTWVDSGSVSIPGCTPACIETNGSAIPDVETKTNRITYWTINNTANVPMTLRNIKVTWATIPTSLMYITVNGAPYWMVKTSIPPVIASNTNIIIPANGSVTVAFEFGNITTQIRATAYLTPNAAIDCLAPTPTPSCVSPLPCPEPTVVGLDGYIHCPVLDIAPGMTECQILPTPTPSCVSPLPCPEPTVVGLDGYIHCPVLDIAPGMTECQILPTPTPTPTPTCVPLPPPCPTDVRCSLPPYPPGGGVWCSSRTPTSSPSPTPTCVRHEPSVSIYPGAPSGNPGQKLTYYATITNHDSYGCLPSTIALSHQVDTNFVFTGATAITIPAGGTTTVSFTVTSPVNTANEVHGYPISYTVTNTASGMSGQATVAYTLLMPEPQPMKFRLKFAGVTGAEADGKTVTIRFYLTDGRVMEFAAPLVVRHVDNDVYEASATLANPLPPNTAFTVGVKGEKHLRLRFCQFTGQTTPCVYGHTMEYAATGPVYFDFTGRPLPAGDLNQNSIIDTADIKIWSDIINARPISLQTDADRETADINFDGVVNNVDLGLILQSLSTRYDE